MDNNTNEAIYHLD